MSEAAFPVEPARVRRPRLGYLMAAAAALLWGVNGAVSKTILATGLSSERLAQVRSLGAAVGLVAILAFRTPGRLRLTRRELPYLARLRHRRARVRPVVLLPCDPSPRDRRGAADRVPRAAARRALGPLRVQGSRPPPDLGGVGSGADRSGLIVNLFGGGTSLAGDGRGVRPRGGRRLCDYVLLAEHVVGGRDAVSLLAWGFLFASCSGPCSHPGGHSRATC